MASRVFEVTDVCSIEVIDSCNTTWDRNDAINTKSPLITRSVELKRTVSQARKIEEEELEVNPIIDKRAIAKISRLEKEVKEGKRKTFSLDEFRKKHPELFE
jgi:TATA-binding protein-associated factor Taf7